MSRLCFGTLLVGALIVLPVDTGSLKLSPMRHASAHAEKAGAKDAFEAAKDLGTVEAWEAFLARHPDGFYADLARGHVRKLKQGRSSTSPTGGPAPAAQDDEEETAPAAAEEGEDETAPAATEDKEEPPAAAAEDDDGEGGAIAADRREPAVTRGGDFMGFPEKFNRYYTDPAWQASRIIYVSPDGGGDGATLNTPMSVKEAIAAARPGTVIYFLRGKYDGCFGFEKENSGTYDQPIVLYAERNKDRTIGVQITCCNEGRATCFNFEDANYIAVDGFELIGGNFGVRAVGADYAASKHSRGIAVMNCDGHDQDRDPFFTGHSDWAVFENNVGHGAKKGDGHGMYLSNGGDWNIVRFNETHSNASSDFQINADPASTCTQVGIEHDDPRCDAYAGEGEGGQGASDYFLVDGNYFHRSAVGPNFTSVRRSVIRNNVFGPQERHNVSFWQETENPKLGSSDNKILHNIFITRDKHAVQFINHSTRNEFANNVLLGTRVDEAGKLTVSPYAMLMGVDDTVGENVYRGNLYVAGKMEGREAGEGETAMDKFSAGWFKAFGPGMTHDANDFTPTKSAPYLGKGEVLEDAPADRNGVARDGAVDLGPIEVE